MRPSGCCGKSKSFSSFCVRNAEQITSAFVTSMRWSSPNSSRSVSMPANLNTSFMTATQNSLSAAAQKSSLASRSQSATLTVSARAANASITATRAIPHFRVLISSSISQPPAPNH